MTPRPPLSTDTPALKAAVLEQRPFYIQAAWISLVNGLLLLAPQWFMFEVYGRVLNSRNVNTLVMLLLMVVGVYVVLEMLDLVRSRVLHRAGERFDRGMRQRLFDLAFEANLRRQPGGTTQTFNDLRTVKEFISSPAVGAVMDIPAALICLVLLAVISPWLGVIALVGLALQVVLAFMTERRTMPTLSQAMGASIQAQNYASNSLRNAQVLESMGMLKNIQARWTAMQRQFLLRQGEASDYGGINAAAAKLIQGMQGSLLLGFSAWLLLHNELLGGGGMVIVASILGGRVLQPVSQLVAQWRAVAGTRDAAKRLEILLERIPPTPPGMPLPRPQGALSVEAVVAAPPGTPVPVLTGINFALRPAEALMVIGPSAAGKTTLARLLVGVWPAASGKVRLDGVDVFSWNKAELGPHVGYLPQTIELFEGTVAENIARFGSVDMELVRQAAERTGILGFIEALPNGFDTRIGEDGAFLSGGQRQRVGLARAIYGSPRFVVLDEPNANLDEEGEQALIRLVADLKASGCTSVLITHRASLLGVADKILVLNAGQVAKFGPRDEVLAAFQKAREDAIAQAKAAVAAGSPKLTVNPTGRPA